MIYICCRSVPNKLSLTEAALAVASLFPDESNSVYFEKIKSRIEESAKDSLYAYTVLGEMISNHFPAANQADNPLILSRNENGKPYFINSKLKFSISHSKGVVACALSDGEEIGVDVETATFSPEKAQKLSKRYFTVEDQNKIAQDSINFSRIWTQYEAAAKLMGINLADFIVQMHKNDNFTDIIFHKFKCCEIPVTLCTKRSFGKIILLGDNKK